MVVLATIATVIASQAVITGAYSITRQAIQLGLLPRLEIRHTSESHFGQIYMPRVNTDAADRRAASGHPVPLVGRAGRAYGIAVSAPGVTAHDGFIVVIWRVWRWSLWSAAALMAPFLFIDIMFLVATCSRSLEGGWVPLAFGVIVMTDDTWRRGSGF